MTPTVVDNPEASRFEVLLDGQVAGFARYARTATAVALQHTEIDPAYSGRGLGSTLVRGALDALRADGATVLPHCSFVRDYVARHPDYLDLVEPGHRARFGLAPDEASADPDRRQ